MTSEEAVAALRESGAILEGHFVLSSGRHSDLYVEKFRVLEKPVVAKRLAETMAESFSGSYDVVLSPAIGGIIFGFAVALAVAERGMDCRFIFAEREQGRLRLRRGFEIAEGERVLAIEDVVTTGASLRELLLLVNPGELEGLGCLVDRSEGLEWPVPLKALAQLPLRSWEAAECRLCARGVPADAPGSRAL